MQLHRMSSEQMDVRYIANLARIDLSEEECSTFQGQLEAVLGYIKKLQDVDVEGIDTTAHTTQIFGSLREDVSTPALSQEDLLCNAPESALGQIRVPKVVDA